jgi:hypothetical protein
MSSHYTKAGGCDDFYREIFGPTTSCFPPSFVSKPFDEYTLPAILDGTVALLRDNIWYTLSHDMDPKNMPPPYIPKDEDEDEDEDMYK